jgi:uncharacterized protein YceH (UPF0502 family)
VLMLRGAQTPGELKQRTERLEGFADLGAVQEVIERLIERGFVIRHPRRPGQKEDRFEQVLGGDDAVELVPDRGLASAEDGAEGESTSTEPRSSLPADEMGRDDRASGGAGKVDRAPSVAEETARLDRLEADLLELKGEIARLREALGD